jgi:hypothetical protein
MFAGMATAGLAVFVFSMIPPDDNPRAVAVPVALLSRNVWRHFSFEGFALLVSQPVDHFPGPL